MRSQVAILGGGLKSVLKKATKFILASRNDTCHYPSLCHTHYTCLYSFQCHTHYTCPYSSLCHTHYTCPYSSLLGLSLLFSNNFWNNRNKNNSGNKQKFTELAKEQFWGSTELYRVSECPMSSHSATGSTTESIDSLLKFKSFMDFCVGFV